MTEKIRGIKALGDKTRIKIIQLLLSSNYCVGALAKKLNISESAVSQHLKILRKADIVLGEKKGYYVHYKVKTKKLKEIGNFIINLKDINRKEEDCIISDECCQAE